MPIFHRRVVLSGGLVFLTGSLAAGRRALAVGDVTISPHTRGCLLAHADEAAVLVTNGEATRIAHGPDRQFDRQLADTLSEISDLFGVLPAFGYYDDSASPNGFATPRVTVTDRPTGTVLLGLNLLQRLLKSPEYPAVAVAAVCAHEFGHMVQFRYDLIPKVNAGQKTILRSELQADFFAGYFAGRQKRQRSDYPAAVVAQTQFGVGDDDFDNPQHHGTREQRGAAVVAGFQTAVRDGKSMPEAVEASMSYVMGINV